MDCTIFLFLLCCGSGASIPYGWREGQVFWLFPWWNIRRYILERFPSVQAYTIPLAQPAWSGICIIYSTWHMVLKRPAFSSFLKIKYYLKNIWFANLLWLNMDCVFFSHTRKYFLQLKSMFQANLFLYCAGTLKRKTESWVHRFILE